MRILYLEIKQEMNMEMEMENGAAAAAPFFIIPTFPVACCVYHVQGKAN